jgi:hypothetical protein
MTMKRKKNSGMVTMEFVLSYGALLLPVSMMIVYTAQLLWVWNTMVDFTRQGARYAATHCWQGAGENVKGWMRQNLPATFDRDQFAQGPADFEISYFSKDPESGGLVEFSCESGECSVSCIPDMVRVRVISYEFRTFFSYLGLPPLPMPDFQTAVPMESAGCNQESGECLP